MENSADFAVICILTLSALWGAVRGFAKEIFALSVWVGAFVLAGRIAPLLLPWISKRFSDPVASAALAYVIAFIVLALLLSAVARRFAEVLHDVLLGGTDHLLGCFFGLARGYIFLVILYVAIVSFASEQTAQSLIAGSRSGPYILAGVHIAQGLVPYFPQLHLAMPPVTGHEAAF